MPIKPMKGNINFTKLVNEKIKYFDKQLEDVLKEVGKTTVDYIRSLDTYQNQTANLRNSEGCILFKDGKAIYEYYPNDAKPKTASTLEGAAIGKGLANDVGGVSKRDGYFLVVTAAMGYAAYVEAKGRDVITGGGKEGSILLKARVKTMMAKINKRKK